MSSLGALSSGGLERGCPSKLQFICRNVRKLLQRRHIHRKAQKSEKFRIGVLGANDYTGSENEEFVVLLKNKEVPHTRHVRGSNYCLVNVFPDPIPGRAIIVSVIDNLVKGGASGQALNLMMGIPGLLYMPLFPLNIFLPFLFLILVLR